MKSKSFEIKLGLVACGLFMLVACLLVVAPPAQAAGVYVDAVHGNDSTGDGSVGNPYRTIGKGLSVSADTVHVKPGVYSKSLGESFPITIPDNVTLQSTDGPQDTIIRGTTADDKHVLRMNNNSMVEGFTLEGIGGSWFTAGVYTVKKTGVEIKNNIIKGNDTGFAGVIFTDSSGKVENNVIWDATGSGIMGLASTKGSTAEIEVKNNTVYGGDYGLYAAEILSGDQTIDAVNNIIKTDKTGVTNGPGQFPEETIISKYNLIDSPTPYEGTIDDKTGDITGQDPLLSNPAGGDFYLWQTAAGQDKNSPAVNAGSGSAQHLGFGGMHTRTDAGADVGTVDLGYHYAGAAPAVTMDNNWPASATRTVTVRYHLLDGNSLPGDTQVEYSLDNGVHWQVATSAGGDGTVGLNTSPDGIQHTFLWNSASDAPKTKVSDAKIRITATNNTYAMPGWATSESFVLDNEHVKKDPDSNDSYGPNDTIVTIAGVGGSPQVLELNHNGSLRYSPFYAYAQSLHTGANITTGDLNGDGEDEIIVAPRAGGSPQIRIFDKYGQAKFTPGFFAYSESIRCGVDVTTGDLNGDGHEEIITVPGEGCPAQVRVFDYRGLPVLTQGFYAYAQDTRVGFRVSAGDLNDDGVEEIVTVPEKDAVAQVRIFNAVGQAMFVPSFNAFGDQKTGGDISVGDLDGDDKGEIVVVAGPGFPSHVRMFNYLGDPVLSPGFYAYDQNLHTGVNLTTGDINQDNKDDIITVPKAGVPAQVQVFNPRGEEPLTLGFFAYPESFRIGGDVAVGLFDK